MHGLIRSYVNRLGTLQYFSTKSFLSKQANFESSSNKQPRPKTIPEERITLIAQDNSISITPLTEAQKLSGSKNLRLVKIKDIDTKTRRPVYKLMTSADYHQEELRKRTERQKSREQSDIKGDKLLAISHSIADHDINTKIKNLAKWLVKQYQVKIVIEGKDNDSKEKSEKLYARLEGELKNLGKFTQKRMQGKDLKFQVLPIAKAENNTVELPNTASKRNMSTTSNTGQDQL